MAYRRGSKGDMVRRIQRTLSGAGYPLIQDGHFGAITEEAVKAFQRERGLKDDGIAGPVTLAAIFIAEAQQQKSATDTVSGEGHRLKKTTKRTITEIIVHCSATPEGLDYTVDQIRADHKKQGWSDIGYHVVIYRDGTIHDGRPMDLIGAHCSKGGHNTHSIGVCYIGGLENQPGVPYAKLKAKDTRTHMQKIALMSVLMELREYYPDAKIYGHHDFDRGKDCPSFDAKKEYMYI